MPQNVLHIVYLRLPVIIHLQLPGRTPQCFHGYYDVRLAWKVSSSARILLGGGALCGLRGSYRRQFSVPSPYLTVGRQLTPFAAASTVKASPYERERAENPDWPALEE